jgi:chaperonin GroEL
MNAKILLFDDAAHRKIADGVDILADAVMLTLGPRGRTVLLQQPFGAPTVVNSGVIVAKAIELEDPFEDMGAQMVREVALRTSEMAGDGTTTATLLARAMVREGMKVVAAGMNPMDVRRGIEQATQRVVEALRQLAQPCRTSAEIAHVAAISGNNDRSIGTLIAQAMDKVGREGAITIEDGTGVASELLVVEGLQFDRGFLSAYFITQADKQQAVLEDPVILLADRKIATVKDVLPALELVAKEGRPLLMVCDELEGEALATPVVNHLRGVVKCCAARARIWRPAARHAGGPGDPLGRPGRQRATRPVDGAGDPRAAGTRPARRSQQGSHHGGRWWRRSAGDRGAHDCRQAGTVRRCDAACRRSVLI